MGLLYCISHLIANIHELKSVDKVYMGESQQLCI